MYILLRPNEHKSGKGMPDLTIIVIIVSKMVKKIFFFFENMKERCDIL